MDSSGSNLVIALSLLFLLFRPSVSQQPNTDSFYVSTFFQTMGVPLPLSLPKDDDTGPEPGSSSSSLVKNNTNFNICSWKGVSCDVQQQFVTSLSASNLGLSGPIPDTTLGKLTKLQSLDLSNNKINGSLPSDLWSLTSLEYLNLSTNQISGTLSSNVGNFGSLESLDLSVNNFSGKIPEAISSLQKLKFLKLSRNGFESLIPSGIVNCRSLVSVDLSENKLNGSLPHGFGSAFPDLKDLNLANNGIMGRAVDLYGLGGTKISSLNISGNLFEGSMFMSTVFVDEEDMADDHEEQEAALLLPLDLEVIDLSRNQFEGQFPTEVTTTSTNTSTSLFNWSRLIYLDLSENNLSGQISNVLINQALNLRHLNLAYNQYSDQKFPSLDNLTHLEYLNLSQSSLTRHVSFEVLSQLKNLTTLDISNNMLNGPMPPRLLNDDDTNNLQVLDVSFNNLTGSIPVSILQMLPYMESYNFSYNNLTICPTSSHEMFQSAFIGLESDCPIAANATFIRTKPPKGRGLKLALGLTLSMIFLFVGLLLLAFKCQKRSSRMWVVKPSQLSSVPATTQKDQDQQLQQLQQEISGPFSFQTDSSTWVADVKQATMVPVVIFDKPLLNITFADLLAATSNFDRGTLLAEGRFGPVYRGFLAGGTLHVAVKVLVHGSMLTDQEAARELEHLGRIKHPNLVPLTGYCLAGEQRIAIYEYMENGNLQNLLHDLPLGVRNAEDHGLELWEEVDNSNNGVRNICSEGLLTTWRFRHKIALGTARALAFLHHGCSPPIVHRDVKASSVYLDSELEPRLSDFGLAKVLGNGSSEDNDNDDDDEEDHHITRGSSGYVPPELTEQNHARSLVATPKSDVYGFGVILFELITGKKPVEDDYPDGTLVSWVRGLVKKNQGLKAVDQKIRGTGSDRQMEEALKIGYLCTADLPSKRPSMHQIVGLLKDIKPVNE